MNQSDRNSFGGDFVLYSVSMASRDGDSILDQAYEQQLWSDYSVLLLRDTYGQLMSIVLLLIVKA